MGAIADWMGSQEHLLADSAELLSVVAVLVFIWWINLLRRYARMERQNKLQFDITKTHVRNIVDDHKTKWGED